MKEGVDWAEEGEERYQPCCYNTVTGEETVLMRSCGLNCSVYAVNVTSDYLLVSYTDDPAGDGESLKIEKLSDPAVVFDVGELVRVRRLPMPLFSRKLRGKRPKKRH
jgi:hypothetical protein